MMENRARSLLLGLALALLLSGCGGDGQDRDAATGEILVKQQAIYPEEDFLPSPEGHFKIIWPDGCTHVRTRMDSAEGTTDPGRLAMIHVFCDREGREHEGCSVTVYPGYQDDFGGPPSPQNVIDLLKEQMERFQVSIVSQTPLQRGTMQGLQIHCHEPGDGVGTVWLEGYLLDTDIYILSAWRVSGDLFEDAVFLRFFDSFTLIPVDSGSDEG
jgi:hypothetical protein